MQWCCRSKCLVLFLGLKFWAIVLAPARPNQGYQIEENLVRWAASDANRFLSRSCATHTRHIHWGSHGWMWFALPRNLCSKQHGDISYSRSLRVYIVSKSSVKKKKNHSTRSSSLLTVQKNNNPGPWYLRLTWEPENWEPVWGLWGLSCLCLSWMVSRQNFKALKAHKQLKSGPT